MVGARIAVHAYDPLRTIALYSLISLRLAHIGGAMRAHFAQSQCDFLGLERLPNFQQETADSPANNP